MASWIKSRKQTDGSFAIVITREVVGTDGNTATIEDFITRASPLEFANAILRAHGVEPAHVFGAALTRQEGAKPETHHAVEAPMPAFDPIYPEEPALRANPLGRDEE